MGSIELDILQPVLPPKSLGSFVKTDLLIVLQIVVGPAKRYLYLCSCGKCLHIFAAPSHRPKEEDAQSALKLEEA